jgi:hypothetical protein
MVCDISAQPSNGTHDGKVHARSCSEDGRTRSTTLQQLDLSDPRAMSSVGAEFASNLPLLRLLVPKVYAESHCDTVEHIARHEL